MLVCCVRMKSVCSMYVPPTTTSITINRTSNASGVLHIELIIPTHLHPAQPVPRGCLLLERPEAKKPPRSQTTRQYVHNRKCSLVIWPCKDRRSGHLGAFSSRRTSICGQTHSSTNTAVVMVLFRNDSLGCVDASKSAGWR